MFNRYDGWWRGDGRLEHGEVSIIDAIIFPIELAVGDPETALCLIK